MRIRVDGGTNAGNKPSLKPRPKPWQCKCWVETKPIVAIDLASPLGAASVESTRVEMPKTNPGFLVACTDCGERRPE